MMKEIYLINNVDDSYISKDREEIIPLFQDEKILLSCRKYNDKYQLCRKEKISFLEENTIALDITFGEYEELVRNKQKDNISLGIMKDIYTYANGDIIEKYDGMFEGLIKLVIEEDENEYEGNHLNSVEKINITEKDIARDDRLINISEEEFTFEVAQIRLENEQF